MDKEKEKVTSHKTSQSSTRKTAQSASHKTSQAPARKSVQSSSHKSAPSSDVSTRKKADTPKSSSGSAAKKVVSKAAKQEHKPAASELNHRRSSSGTKRTTSAQSASSKRKPTTKKKKKTKNNTWFSSVFEKLPSAARFLVKILCVVLALVLIITVWTSATGWSLGDLCRHGVQTVKDSHALGGRRNDFPLILSGSHSIKQEKVGGGIAVLTDTSLTFYSKKGNMARSQAHYIANPALAAESNYALVYDIGGDRWRFETASSTLSFGKAEYSILSGNVSRSGYFSLVCSDSERHSSVYVYDRSGNKIFGWKSADYYITASALSSNGRTLVVCGLNAENGVLKSTAIVFDVFKSKEISREFFSDALLLDVKYLKSGKAVIIGENHIITVSKDGKSFDAELLDEDITAYDSDYSSGLVYCTSPVDGSSMTTLTALDTNGNQRFSQQLDCNVTDIALSSDYVSVLSHGYTDVYTISGKHIKKAETAVDAKKIAVIKDNVYILCNTVLRREGAK